MKRLLFFGDSITDMCRQRELYQDTVFAYGTGYVFCLAADLAFKHPGEYQIINRGIGGNEVTDLLCRYKEDVVAHNPDLITIQVGVNDIGHQEKNLKMPFEKYGVNYYNYGKTYRLLIKALKEELPNAKIILIPPFLIDNNNFIPVPFLKTQIQKYRSFVKKLAKETGCFVVDPYRKLNELAKKIPPQDLCYDGVHTNATGALIVAKEWEKVFEKIKL